MNKGNRETPRSMVPTDDFRDNFDKIFGKKEFSSSKKRYIWRNGEFVEIPEDYSPPPRKTPYIIGDYQPYKCSGLGEVVKSRKHRRELMKEKGLIEVGNDYNSIMSINDGRYDDVAYEAPSKELLEQVKDGL